MLSRESINILDRFSVHSSQISDGNDYQNYKNEKYRLMSVDGDLMEDDAAIGAYGTKGGN